MLVNANDSRKEIVETFNRAGQSRPVSGLKIVNSL